MTVLPLAYEGLIASPYTETNYTILMNRNHSLATQTGIRLEQRKRHSSLLAGPL